MTVGAYYTKNRVELTSSACFGFPVGAQNLRNLASRMDDIRQAHRLDPRQGCDEQGTDKLKNDVLLGALPCRGEHGFPANRVYGYLCAMPHHVAEWYKYDCLGNDEQTLRLPTIVQRDFTIAARGPARASPGSFGMPRRGCFVNARQALRFSAAENAQKTPGSTQGRRRLRTRRKISRRNWGRTGRCV